MALNFNIKERWVNFIESSKRIFTVSKKPDKQEYMTMIKVTGIGILIIGVIGYVVILIARIITMFLPTA